MRKYYVAYTYKNKKGEQLFDGCFIEADTLDENALLECISNVSEDLGLKKNDHIVPLHVTPIDHNDDTIDEDENCECNCDTCEDCDHCFASCDDMEDTCKCDCENDAKTSKDDTVFKRKLEALTIFAHCLFDDEEKECKNSK